MAKLKVIQLTRFRQVTDPTVANDELTAASQSQLMRETLDIFQGGKTQTKTTAEQEMENSRSRSLQQQWYCGGRQGHVCNSLGQIAFPFASEARHR
jgi:hypothetical protein